MEVGESAIQSFTLPLQALKYLWAANFVIIPSWLTYCAGLGCLYAAQAEAEKATAAAQQAADDLRAKLDASEGRMAEARGAQKAAEEKLADLEGAIERETASLKVVEATTQPPSSSACLPAALCLVTWYHRHVPRCMATWVAGLLRSGLGAAL